MTATSKGQGMEIPIEIVQLKGGKQYVKISIQGKELMQGLVLRSDTVNDYYL